uniref:Uncharacterized protein n=1 Tax=viral metagenome TaxID=1070528 RepID=A0A6C0EBH7_9ZZZZ
MNVIQQYLNKKENKDKHFKILFIGDSTKFLANKKKVKLDIKKLTHVKKEETDVYVYRDLYNIKSDKSEKFYKIKNTFCIKDNKMLLVNVEKQKLDMFKFPSLNKYHDHYIRNYDVYSYKSLKIYVNDNDIYITFKNDTSDVIKDILTLVKFS